MLVGQVTYHPPAQKAPPASGEPSAAPLAALQKQAAADLPVVVCGLYRQGGGLFEHWAETAPAGDLLLAHSALLSARSDPLLKSNLPLGDRALDALSDALCAAYARAQGGDLRLSSLTLLGPGLPPEASRATLADGRRVPLFKLPSLPGRGGPRTAPDDPAAQAAGTPARPALSEDARAPAAPGLGFSTLLVVRPRPEGTACDIDFRSPSGQLFSLEYDLSSALASMGVASFGPSAQVFTVRSPQTPSAEGSFVLIPGASAALVLRAPAISGSAPQLEPRAVALGRPLASPPAALLTREGQLALMDGPSLSFLSPDGASRSVDLTPYLREAGAGPEPVYTLSTSFLSSDGRTSPTRASESDEELVVISARSSGRTTTLAYSVSSQEVLVP